MSATYAVPGVYVEEPHTLSMSVQSGETAVPVFIGHFNCKDGKADLECVPIESWLAFTEVFAGSDAAAVDAASWKDPDAAGLSVKSHTEHVGSYSVRLYFENGGGPCYVLPLLDVTVANLASLPEKIAACPDITLLCWCEHRKEDGQSGDNSVYAALGPLIKADSWGNRGYFLLADAGLTASSAFDVPNVAEPTQAAAYFPALQTSYRYDMGDAQITVAGLKPDADGWSAGSLSLAAMRKEVEYAKKSTDIAVKNGGKLDPTKGAKLCGAIRALVDGHVKDKPVYLRASCAMAGVIARTDRERGVWKAPANAALNGVADLVAYDSGSSAMKPFRIDDAVNAKLVDAKVNAIRAFRGKGHLAWGARTMADPSLPAWRYIPVRRLFNAAERDLRQALRVAMFEPNSPPTWERVRSAIDIYLHDLWLEGALLGDTPEQAYFVRIGLGVTMNATDIANGQMIVKVGMAAVRPAEFIILRLTQDVVPA